MDTIKELHDLGYSKLASMIQEGEVKTNNKAFLHICNEGPPLNSTERIDVSKKAIALVASYYNSSAGSSMIIIISNYKLDKNRNISSFMIGHISVRAVSLPVAITISNKIVELADRVDDLNMRRIEIIDISGELLYTNDINLK